MFVPARTGQNAMPDNNLCVQRHSNGDIGQRHRGERDHNVQAGHVETTGRAGAASAEAASTAPTWLFSEGNDGMVITACKPP